MSCIVHNSFTGETLTTPTYTGKWSFYDWTFVLDDSQLNDFINCKRFFMRYIWWKSTRYRGGMYLIINFASCTGLYYDSSFKIYMFQDASSYYQHSYQEESGNTEYYYVGTNNIVGIKENVISFYPFYTNDAKALKTTTFLGEQPNQRTTLELWV